MKINLPSSLTLANSLNFQNELKNIKPSEDITFDFSRCKGILEPSGMLLAATAIRKFCILNNDKEINFIDYLHMSYAAHMGFFQFFGVKFGNKPGEANGSSSYNPLTIVETSKIRDSAIINGTEVGDEVESFCEKLTHNLCHEKEENLFDTLKYSMRELMRNVVEHSCADEIIFCSQYWPTKNVAEVCIIDEGVGIMQTLKKNPHIDASSDKKWRIQM